MTDTDYTLLLAMADGSADASQQHHGRSALMRLLAEHINSERSYAEASDENRRLRRLYIETAARVSESIEEWTRTAARMKSAEENT